jgi:hypothetical protein
MLTLVPSRSARVFYTPKHVGFRSRSAELEEMLDGLDLRTELIYRFALREISSHCRGDYRFALRTDALQTQLRLDEDEFAEILREAGALEQGLRQH